MKLQMTFVDESVGYFETKSGDLHAFAQLISHSPFVELNVRRWTTDGAESYLTPCILATGRIVAVIRDSTGGDYPVG